MSAQSDPERTDRASRVVHAPAEAVYAALTDAEAVAAFMAPEGMTGTVLAFDPRPGGVFRMELRYRNRAGAPGKTSDDTDGVDGMFVALEPNRRIVQAFSFVSDDPAYAGTMTMTWSLTRAADGTEILVECTEMPPGIDPGDHAAGLASTLDNLAAWLDRSE